MTDRLSSWWNDRSGREQGLLAVMLALVTLLLGWLLVVQPLIHALDDARLSHGEAVIAVAEARAEADVRRRAAARPIPRATLPIERILGETAAAAGFTGARITGQGPVRAVVAIDAARPQAFFGWVSELQQRGVVLETLQARTNADRTLSAQAVLRVAGR